MAMEMETGTTISHLPTISQATVITEIMEMVEMVVVSTAIQVVGHKMIISLNLMHLSNSHSSHPDQTISTFHRHKIAQMEMAMVISIHKPDTDTKPTK